MKKTHAPFPPLKNEQKKSGKEPCLLPPSKVRKNNKIFTDSSRWIFGFFPKHV
jgi:hypothetical protein